MATLPASNWQRIIFEPLLKQAGGVDKLMDELRDKTFYYDYTGPAPKAFYADRKKKKPVSWQFNAPADYLIDYERIANELSYKHPVAVVRRGKTIHNILIHKSIINKAHALNYNLAPCIKKLTCTCYEIIINHDIPSTNDNESLGEWLEWVKEVKAAKHVQVFVRELQTVNVNVPL